MQKFQTCQTIQNTFNKQLEPQIQCKTLYEQQTNPFLTE